MVAVIRPTVALLVLSSIIGSARSAQYLGKFLGKLTELHHGVSGEVYAVDGKTLHIKDFTYDGQGPAAYFYAGNSRSPSNAGFRIPDENGNPGVLKRYRKEGVTITLPEGKTLNNIKWFSVWCEEFEVNFGDVKIPRNFDFPRPQKIDPLKGVHGISSDNIVIVDAQTLLIPNLSYDGEAPDAKFWVGRSSKPTPQGIRVPDENGKEIPLRRYDRKTIVLTLPGDLTVFDIGHFGIWCEAFTVDFGHVLIPQNVNIPPSLKMLGVSPQSKLNCEVLHDDLAFEVRWAVAGDSIVFQLVAKLDDREYMSFGVSGDDTKTTMVGGDVVVAWVDKDTSKGFAEDYYLDAKSQCSGPKGSCPDSKLGNNEHDNNIRLLNAAMVNGYSIITYQRPLKPSDEFDKAIPVNKSQSIIWAIGPLNERNEVSFHTHYLKDDKLLNFGRPAKWNCPTPESEQPPMKPIPTKAYLDGITQESSPSRNRNQERRRGESRRGAQNRQESIPDSEKSASRPRQQTERSRGSVRKQEKETTTKVVPTPAPVKNRNAWDIPPIQCYEPEDGVFYAQMGPTGGKRGYPAITGHVGWGISWYINGLLIPVINVVRGKTYTFVVEGGFDPDIPAKYHPFYITDDPIGGYEYKTPEEKKKVHIYAGAKKGKDGAYAPTGVGRLCHWTPQGDSEADDFDSFGAYQRTLELKCDQGEPGVIQWTPDDNTPDVVYYQCFTHRYLGWKINVLDSCDTGTAASELKPSIVLPDSDFELSEDEIERRAEDLESSPSIQVASIVKPNDIPDYETKNTEKPEIDYTTDTKYETINPQTEPIIQQEPQVSVQTEESFLVPQPNFFDQSYFLAQTQLFPTHYNPYAQYQYQYPNQYQQSFRPSQFIDGLFPEQPRFEMTPEPLNQATQPTTSTTTTTTTTTSTTTEKYVPSTSTTEKPSEPIKKLIVPSIRPQLPNIHNGIAFRRPMFPPKYARPPSTAPTYKNVMRIPVYAPRPAASTISFKKTLYRPPSKTPQMLPRPTSGHLNNKHETAHPNKHEIKPIVLSNVKTQLRPHPPNIIIMKPQQVDQKPSPSRVYVSHPNIEFDHIPTRAELERHPFGRPLLEIDRSNAPPQPPKQDINKPVASQHAEKSTNLSRPSFVEAPNKMKVEISPQQPSTERNPETQTPKQYAPVISVKKTEEAPVVKMRPAINTGFHPETVVVEGGFKPIVSQEIQKRKDDVEYPQLEYASEIGVINIKKREQEKYDSQQEVESFEPVFVPSPLDKQQMDKILKLQKRRPHHHKKTTILLVIKQPRSIQMPQNDEIAEAAERVESYYLPPADNKNKPVEVSRQPSNIDFPPGVVITFDGKRVSGQSLTAKSNGGSVLESRSSKATELLKASKPQTEKFKGDIPPLDRIYINPNAPQLQQQGSISRDLGVPSSGTTKLSLVRQIEQDEVKVRRKRDAHHTPEHTAEQQNENKEKAKNSSSSNRGFDLTILCLFVIAYLVNYH